MTDEFKQTCDDYQKALTKYESKVLLMQLDVTFAKMEEATQWIDELSLSPPASPLPLQSCSAVNCCAADSKPFPLVAHAPLLLTDSVFPVKAYFLYDCDGHLAGLKKVRGFRAFIKSTMDECGIFGSIRRINIEYEENCALLHVQCAEDKHSNVVAFLQDLEGNRMIASFDEGTIIVEVPPFSDFTIKPSGLETASSWPSDSEDDEHDCDSDSDSSASMDKGGRSS